MYESTRKCDSNSNSAVGKNQQQQQIEELPSHLILSTDPKPRLRWTVDLHQRFVDAVNQLGGPDNILRTNESCRSMAIDNADTFSTMTQHQKVMKLMRVDGLTLYHLKSHLQKYRLGKPLQKCSEEIDNALGGEVSLDSSSANFQVASHNQETNFTAESLSEALRLQMEVQKKLHEQLEVQKHLQLRIEAQGRYLQAILETAKETFASNGSLDLDETQKQLSALSSSVMSQCLDPAVSLLVLATPATPPAPHDQVHHNPSKKQRTGSKKEEAMRQQSETGKSVTFDLNLEDEPTISNYRRDLNLNNFELGL